MQFNEQFFDELGRSPAVEQLVTQYAAELAADIITTGPRDTNDYVNGIKVVVKHQKRVVALVVATDRKSLLLESKGGYMVRALNRKKRSRG